MSLAIRVLTIVLFLVPLGILALSFLHLAPALVAAVMLAIYAWVWLRFRPTRFVVGKDAVEVIWPLKRRRIPRQGITSVRLLDARELRAEMGVGFRVGAGGLWGGFGWLWTTRRGIVQMYISRTDRFVWIERGKERPWLITPERAEAFVEALRGA